MRYLPLIVASFFALSSAYAQDYHYETEVNDGMPNADDLSLEKITLGQLNSAFDVDWFKFNVTDTSQVMTIRVAFSGGSVGDFGVAIYNQSETLLANLINQTVTEEDQENDIIVYGGYSTSVNYEFSFPTTGMHYVAIYCPLASQDNLQESVQWSTAPYYISAHFNDYCDLNQSGRFNGDDSRIKIEQLTSEYQNWFGACSAEHAENPRR